MELKGRLKLIADKAIICQTLSDIGTDHAYIPIYLIKNNICNHAIACDVKNGPLSAAKKNIEMFGLSGKIETRLGDGLEPLGNNECDVIIIAGMGGNLINRILTDDFEKAKNCKNLVLQPMNEIEKVREWLYTNGFDIIDEELTREGEKIYTVLTAQWTGNKTKLDEEYYYFGSKLIEKKDPLLDVIIKRKINQLEAIVHSMEEGDFNDIELKNKNIELILKFRALLEIANKNV